MWLYHVRHCLQLTDAFRPPRIPVPFGYIPLTRPGPFSALRQLSYAENAPLLGPTVDLEGWHRVNPITVQGTLFNNRDVSFRCTVSLVATISAVRPN